MIGRWNACMLVVALAACGGNKTEQAAATDKPVAEPTDPETKLDAPPKRAAVTPQRLAPIIHALGPDKVVPTAIVIELGVPVVERDMIGSASAHTELKLTPELAGTLVYSGPSQLTFTPGRPFDFDTTYKVELTRLETSGGVIEPSPGTSWSYSFKTPPFRFVSWTPSDVNLERHRVTMAVTFSGAVLPNVSRGALTFALDGQPLAGVNLLPTPARHELQVQLSDPRLAVGSKLSLVVAGGVMAFNGTKGAGASAEHTLTGQRGVSIKAATLVEGSNGYYLEVVCDDDAAGPGNRAYYEHDAYFSNLSSRCQLTDDSISRIQFDPPVAKAYITSGRAGFRVFGEFRRGAYSVRIDRGATSVDGGVVLAPFGRTFSVSTRRPQLTFASSGRYLPRSAWNNLGIKHLNVEAVNLVVRQIPAENLVFWLGNDGSEDVDERTSNVVLRKTIALPADPDLARTTWLDVAALLPATTTGVLELKLIGVGAQATSRLLLTNMSVVAKKSAPAGKPQDQVVRVWALDMSSAEQLGGVDVALVRKSGKVVARCTTTGASGCTLAARSDDDPDPAVPFALIARRGNDLTYLRYSDLRADVAESSTSGVPYVSDTPYRAAVYSDRGVYRPGDTAHVVAIVRDARDRAPDVAVPVDIKLIDPRTKLVRKLTVKTNPGGMIAFDHTLPAFADTGHWRVALTIADKPLASHDLQVEEFVPERMKVTAEPKQADALMRDRVAIGVGARYLFGGSAMDSTVKLTCAVEPERFAPDDNGELTYGVEPKGKPVQLGEAEDAIGPDGTAEVACPEFAADTAFNQTARLTATAAVLEAGSGRATVSSADVVLHPERYYLGLRTKAAHARPGVTFTVEGLVVDWTGKPVPAAVKQVDVELVHLEADYGYSYDDDSGESRYDRNLRTVPEGSQKVAVSDGKFRVDVTPGSADAGYVVRVRAGKAVTELVLDGEYPYEYYGYGDGGRVDQTPRPAKPTQLALSLPKDIKVGVPATVKLRAPYKGKLLWTVETDKVVTAEWRDVAPGDASWTFTVSAFAPNVYVGAFLVKDPHLESRSAFLPDRAYGVASARVTPSELTQAVTLDVPKDVRSNSPLTVKLRLGATAGPTFATVAVVDEGILSLTGFRTPDPLAQLLPKRALGVETYETIGWTMLHQPAGASSRTGGGGDEMYGEEAGEGELGAGRVQPVKPVALFSGVVQVAADGTATIPFQVPSYRGELRVMAVTASGSRIGRAEAKVTVKDPLVIQVTFPRFVTHNDEMDVPVFLTNMSGGPLDVSVKLDSEHLAIPGLAAAKAGAPPPLAFVGKDTGGVRLDHGRSETVVFQVKAAIPIGGARLRVTAKARGLEVKDEVDVPFLPAGPKERAIQKIKLAAGPLDIAAQAALRNWVPTSETTTLWMTTNPYGESFDHLRYLIHYPYGCIEQTVSSTRPLLYVASLAEQVDPQLAQLQVQDMVLAGIHRVLSMETPSGGFGYWPGATEPLEWATAYATHMLLDAKKAGYAIPDDRLAEVLRWIDGRLAQYERADRIRRQPWNHYDEQSEVYLHYVLALAGKGKKARLARLIESIPATAKGEQAEDLYLLKAALWLAGDRRHDKDLKAVDTSPISPERINSWSFYSDRRRRALMLSTFHDLFGNHAAGELLATRVAEGLTGQPSYYYNTQELVWGVTGLGKWVAAQAARGTAAGTLTADGAPINPRATRAASNDKTWSLARASEYGKLTLDVPASAAGLWLVIRSEGVRPGADYKVGGNGLAVSRTYRALDGSPIDVEDGSIKLGDLVFVEIALGNVTGATIQNIALVDRLPAGFEVENPRLGRAGGLAWAKEDELWQVDFLNMRDDRLEAFGALAPRETRKIVYTVRAVTSGKYTIPPVDAEAMYDPTLWARARGATAVITGSWTGKTI